MPQTINHVDRAIYWEQEATGRREDAKRVRQSEGSDSERAKRIEGEAQKADGRAKAERKEWIAGVLVTAEAAAESHPDPLYLLLGREIAQIRQYIREKM